jgi:hypothetical protein
MNRDEEFVIYKHQLLKNSGDTLAVVGRIGALLQYVENQTPEICMAAVQEDGTAVQFVKNQTPEICMAAIQQNGNALKFIKEHTKELCDIAIQQNPDAYQYAKYPRGEPLKIQPTMNFEPEFKDDDEIRPYGAEKGNTYQKKYDSCVEAIIATIKKRADLGKLKYGTDLDRTDLNFMDWINHAQEELMDGILYLEKLKHVGNRQG